MKYRTQITHAMACSHVHRHKRNILKVQPKERKNTEIFRKGEEEIKPKKATETKVGKRFENYRFPIFMRRERPYLYCS